MTERKTLSEFDRLPKRVHAIIVTCRSGQKLCKDIRQRETGEAELNFFFEPSGKRCGPKSAQDAIKSGLLEPNNDGLLGPESSQTWGARK